MAYHVQLMTSISQKIGKQISEFKPYIDALEQNWYTTEDAIRNLTDEEFYRMKFPGQLIKLIRQKIGYPQQTQQQGQYQQQYQQPQQQYQQYQQPQQPQQQYRGQEQPRGQQMKPNQGGMQPQYGQHQKQPAQYSQSNYNYNQQQNQPVQKSPIEIALVQARKRLGEEEYLACADILLRIFTNIQNNMGEEKYRSINKGNMLGRITAHIEFVQVLRQGGFEDNGQKLVMKKLDLSYLNAVIREIELHSQPKFDPYKATICSLSNTSKIDMHESSQYPQMLEQLKKQRIQLMSTPIKNRDIKIYKFKNQQNTAQNAKLFNLYNQDNPNEDEKIFIQQLKQNLKKLEVGQNFVSKRKAEYVELLKKPCFSQCIARVKCPNNTVFECKFSPMEKLGLLVQYFREHLLHKNMNFYLYMTPPVRVIEGELAERTFFEEDCIPRCLFYFGTELNIGNQEIFTQPKSGFQHM